jgi:hypothetical protein
LLVFWLFFAATKTTIISGNSNAELCKLATIFFYKTLNDGHPISQYGTTSIPNEKSYDIDENSCMNLMNVRTNVLIAKKILSPASITRFDLRFEFCT